MKRSNAPTERLFRDAGLSEGMSVLELGCGPGEVTEMIADMVGPAGRVLAVDRSEEMLSAARERTGRNTERNIRFVCADLNDGPEYLEDLAHASLDAIAGRRVLMYLPDPGSVVAGLMPWLRPGGLVVFEEADSTICPGRVAAMPAHERAVSWLDEMLGAEGVDRSMGFHLPATLIDAGLDLQHVCAEAVIEGQGDQYALGELLRLLAPRLEAAGVATASAIESLNARMNLEKDPSHVFVSGMRFCAHARRP